MTQPKSCYLFFLKVKVEQMMIKKHKNSSCQTPGRNLDSVAK